MGYKTSSPTKKRRSTSSLQNYYCQEKTTYEKKPWQIKMNTNCRSSQRAHYDTQIRRAYALQSSLAEIFEAIDKFVERTFPKKCDTRRKLRNVILIVGWTIVMECRCPVASHSFSAVFSCSHNWYHAPTPIERSKPTQFPLSLPPCRSLGSHPTA